MLRTTIEKLAPSGPVRRALARVGLAPFDSPDLTELHLPEDRTGWRPGAADAPDLADITLMPADWPEPPVDAMLRRTSGTAADNLQSLDYVTEATADEVLAAYESALASYGAVREDHGGGEMVWGSAGEVAFQVIAQPGGFTVLFGGQ
jgi:hypothetical protein